MFLLRPHPTQRESHAATAAVAVAAPTPTDDNSTTTTTSTTTSGVKLDGREWKYVAEGGANVLFRHHPLASDGTTETPSERSVFHGKLLRVKKCDIDHDSITPLTKKPSTKHHQSSSSSSKRWGFFHRSSSVSVREEVATTEMRYSAHYPHPAKVLEYATKDILPYLAGDAGGNLAGNGNVFEQVAQLMEVDQRFLIELNEKLLLLDTRPAHRRHSQVDIKLQYVMVLPDVTLPPPDEDPFVYFDEAIESEDSSVDSESSDEVNGGGLVETTTITIAASSDENDVVEKLFDSIALDLVARPASLPTRGSVESEGDGSSSSSTITSGEGDAEETTSLAQEQPLDEDEDDGDALGIVHQPLPPPPPFPRRRRVLSGNCNIFDCCFRNICVEIKPKIGFKPKGALIPLVKQRVCRFCMHQQYKRAMGKVEEISEYCPLDLFSRNATRIQKALRALQRTPQNNFKVFVRSNDDEVVNVITGLNADALPKGAATSQPRHSCRRKRMGFRHSCQSIGTESDLFLLPPLPTEEEEDEDGDEGEEDANGRLLPDVVELLTKVLLELEILDDLKKMQLLDHIGVDGMWHIHKLLERVQAAAGAGAIALCKDTSTVGQVVDYLQTQETQEEEEQAPLSRCVAFLEVALAQLPDAEAPSQGVAASWRELTVAALEAFYQQLMQRFQVATTLKDCSLLLCLRRAVDGDDDTNANGSAGLLQPPLHHHAGCPNNHKTPVSLPSPSRAPRKFDHLREYEHRVVFRDMVFNCVVAIVDLDVKSHKSVDDYYRLDDKIVQHYMATCGGGGSGLVGAQAVCHEEP